MASDTVYKDKSEQSTHLSSLGEKESQEQPGVNQQSASMTAEVPAELTLNSSPPLMQRGMIVLNKEQLLAYEEKVFSLISENSGKFAFNDLLQVIGGPTHKNILYKALASLAKQGRIARIRGIGKKRIEFYYYDTRKIKRPPPSAAVNYVSL